MRSEFQSRRWQGLVRLAIVVPSLAMVSLVILYCGAFLSAIFLVVEGKTVILIVAVALVVLIIGAWFGASFFRFGVRLFPLKGSGDRDWGAISLLLILIASIIGLYVFAAVKTLPVVVEGISDPATTLDGEAANLIAIGRSVEILFVFLAGLSLWIAAAIVAPLNVLLFNHWSPLNWKKKPHLLFLRRFSSISNIIGLGPIVRGSPSNVRVVFLVGPGTSTRLWNPLMMAFSGMRIRKPFSAAPVCIKCTDDTWQEVVDSLAKSAKGIVIDLSDDSESMEFEKGIIRELENPSKVLSVRSVSGALSEVPDGTIPGVVEFRYDSWIRGAIPVALFTFLASLLLGMALFGTVFSIPFFESLSSDYEIETAVVMMVLTLGTAIFVSWWYAWHPVLKKRSARQLRQQVRSLFPEA